TRFRNPARAVKLAQRATQLTPKDGPAWNTLGVAHYRAGDWQASKKALAKAMALGNGGDAADLFFAAMAHWKLADKDKAREWSKRAVAWMEQNKQTENEELRRFRAEAAALLGVKDKNNDQP